MNVRDFRTLRLDEDVTCDLCVVGSGPAGGSIARELAGSGLRIIVLESGGLAQTLNTDALSESENVGAPRHEDQSLMRPRILGGSSSLWSGRCAPLDEIDYQDRPWVPHSGWPFGPEAMRPFLERSAPHLGLTTGTGYSDVGFWTDLHRRPAIQALDGDLLRPFFWQFSKDPAKRFDHVRYGRKIQAQRAPNVRVLTHSTVLHINTNATATQVQSLDVGGLDGSRRTIRTRAVVLCAGGIENARLLLASNRVCRVGLGNHHDQVGRYLMDHPRGSVASLDIADAARLGPLFGFHNFGGPFGSHRFCQGLRLSPVIQAREGLLNAAIWASESVAADDPWSALQRIARGHGQKGRDAKIMLGKSRLIARGLHAHFVRRQGAPRKLDALMLACTVEQRPDRDSRVMLAASTDRFGMPRSRIDWRVHEQEQHTVRRTARLVAGELARIGLATPVLDDWVRNHDRFPPSFKDVAHPIGTTRMAVDPAQGVVDANCQVHGVDGLYVAGSSVFPTAGHANPTQMLVALAIRLADELRGRLRSAAPGPQAGARVTAPPAAQPVLER